MTEAEWHACTDPQPMLEFLRGRVSDRKLRLFACACCRRTWHLLTDDRSRHAIKIAERFADRNLGAAELSFAYSCAADAYAYLCGPMFPQELDLGTPHFPVPMSEEAMATAGAANAAHRRADYYASHVTRKVEQVPILRDLFGSILFHPLTIFTSSLVWSGGTVTKIAQAIYEDRAFDRLPILADALEDAGCTNADILNHCRQPGEHVRGCWVVDLLLGKE